MNIGKAILEARKAAGMLQTELANRINVTPTYVSRLEHNVSLPSIDLMRKIATATKMSEDQLFQNAIDFPERS